MMRSKRSLDPAYYQYRFSTRHRVRQYADYRYENGAIRWQVRSVANSVFDQAVRNESRRRVCRMMLSGGRVFKDPWIHARVVRKTMRYPQPYLFPMQIPRTIHV
jgi:hypothetical protein